MNMLLRSITNMYKKLNIINATQFVSKLWKHIFSIKFIIYKTFIIYKIKTRE